MPIVRKLRDEAARIDGATPLQLFRLLGAATADAV
jgi:ABC-type maltose transport system permease subunit